MVMNQLSDRVTPGVGVWNLCGFDKLYTISHT